MNGESLQETVMRVLQGQSRDYFIYPNAAAFASEGLDPEPVAAELDRLLQEGVVERELVTIVVGEDNTGEEITDQIGGGYRLLAVPLNPAE